MGGLDPPAMLASLGGALALLLGLAVLLLPLLTPELSRPRDVLWGAVVLLLGLVLVTSADRLTGAPMLGVVLNQLDFKKADRYYGEYSGYANYGYKRYYGSKA